MRYKEDKAIIDGARTWAYKSSGDKLKIVSSIALFMWLGEAWVSYIPEFYYFWVAPKLHTHNFIWIYNLDYSWTMLIDNLGLAVLHTSIWVVPYRILPSLNLLKTDP